MMRVISFLLFLSWILRAISKLTITLIKSLVSVLILFWWKTTLIAFLFCFLSFSFIILKSSWAWKLVSKIRVFRLYLNFPIFIELWTLYMLWLWKHWSCFWSGVVVIYELMLLICRVVNLIFRLFPSLFFTLLWFDLGYFCCLLTSLF